MAWSSFTVERFRCGCVERRGDREGRDDMPLFLDVGNTALKWRLRHADRCIEGGGAHARDWAAQIAAMAASIDGAIDRIYVASVAGKEQDAAIQALLEQQFPEPVSFYYSPSQGAGVLNSYRQPERLGVDRWLAMVEAWHRCGASIVIDCGSAITLDAISNDGRHQGGYIVPGLRMLEASLTGGTGSVRVETGVERQLGPGRSTTECVQNGVLRMSVSFITDAMVALQQCVQDTCSIFITGGDASTLRPYLPATIEYAPELVLDGLERVTATAA